MYAAIDEQDKVYTSGSETYAQIQPAVLEVQRSTQIEQTTFSRAPSRSEEIHSAPQPPSVDSLRHVAHAHSRQGIALFLSFLAVSRLLLTFTLMFVVRL